MIPLRDINPTGKFPYLTIFLIAVNTAIFIYQMGLPQDMTINFIETYGFIPGELTKAIIQGSFSQIWENIKTIISSMFLHGSFMHLISNMWALWLFGDNVEDRLGHFKFLFFYILSGVLAALVHYFFYLNSPIVTIGASGAISGIMGIYFILFPYAKIKTLFLVLWLPFFIYIPAFLYIGLWFISQISNGILSLFGPVYGFGIAWWAHIGGFVYGVYVGRKHKRKWLFRYKV
ncbi:Membrane associated serine protease, rhomboid family [Anaerobranca californiensis DSM 14826]|jgi:membrane associated rhomboid family serine protease|uniref:Membrane associated serine protease, rhomboid family n=1 Tax=Anaerobranca californiensis DSM 14826 TaxID=1120989 RepID=A0A1M6RA92_9FIRM|nr:rhomboid family intramembrane serine protease [Anaerobranca californiensis]SHK29362.1 Membrane associated serine protease, rhomboid family [Anaerobranca californiensis DSM 14826]